MRDSTNEVGVKPLGRSHHLDLQVAGKYLLPENAELQVGQPIAGAAVNAGAVRQVLAWFLAVHDEGIRTIDDAFVALPDTYHITGSRALAAALQRNAATAQLVEHIIRKIGALYTVFYLGLFQGISSIDHNLTIRLALWASARTHGRLTTDSGHDSDLVARPAMCQ